MSETRPAVDPFTAVLEQLAIRRRALEGLEAAIETVRDAFGQAFSVSLGTAVASLPVPDAPAAAPPALSAAPEAAPGRRRRSVTAARATVAKPAPRKSTEDLEARVLAALERQRAPIAVKRLEELLKLPRTAFKAVLTRLIQHRAVIRTGTTTSTRIGVPGVMAAAPPPKPWRVSKNPPGQMGRPPVDPEAADTAVLGALAKGPANGKQLSSLVGIHITGVREALQRLIDSDQVVRSGAGRHVRFSRAGDAPPAEASTDEAAPAAGVPAAPAPIARPFEAALRRVLASGASYAPAELKRGIAATFPTVSLVEVEAACDTLVKSGGVERIALSDRQRRYRLRPGGRK